MDLSAIIFLALFVAWALYLIPKALSRHDDMARGRSVESFSDRLRVLGKGRVRAAAPASRRVSVTAVAKAADTDETDQTGEIPAVTASSVAPSVTPRPKPAASATQRPATAAPVRPATPAPAPATPAALPTRAAARRAARRRRRVLGALLVVTAGLGIAAYLSKVPVWAPVVPLVVVVAFLAVARRTVRREQQARRRPEQDRVRRPAAQVAPAARVDPAEPAEQVQAREEEIAKVTDPLPDDGSLWDPLPMTLPTYVSKARATRTVRTIALDDVSSSGHDAADSALAADAARAEKAAAEEDVAQRKAAGA